MTEAPQQLCPKLNARFRMEALDGEYFLYEPDGDNMACGNASAVLIISLCDGTRTVAELRNILRSVWPEASAQIDADVDAVLTRLGTAGLLTMHPACA